MNKLLLVPKIKYDELLYSYLLRLAELNCFSDFIEFENIFLKNELRGNSADYGHVSYDVREDLNKLLSALDYKGNMLELFVRTSLLPGYAPLVSRDYTSKQIGMIYKGTGFGILLPPTNTMVRFLKRCPKCVEEDKKGGKHYSFYRAHQMPNVGVCYKHGCNLERYTGGRGKELDSDRFEACTGENQSVKYALFAKELLEANVNASLDETVLVLRKKQRECGIPVQYDKEQPSYILEMICKFFESIREFKEEVESIKNTYVADCYRDQVVVETKGAMLMCKCTSCQKEYITTRFRLECGWGCPVCDRKYNEQNFINRLMDIQEHGEYELEKQPSENNPVVSIKHMPCGTSYYVNIRDFLYGHNRCAKCKNRGMEDFVREIKDLCGNNYELVGEFVRTKDKVKIRHCSCGTIQEYKVSNFLLGQRCKKCRPFLRASDIDRIVRDSTSGEYEVVEHLPQCNLRIKNLYDATEKVMSVDYFLQEISRPTPSEILPVKKRKAIILPIRQTAKILEQILNDFDGAELIFLEDVNIEGVEYTQLKRSFQELVKKGILVRMAPGIFSLSGNQTNEEVFRSKYLVRNGKRIGFYSGKSFAYAIGFVDEKPEITSIVTNKESQLHGRTKELLGIKFKIHGSRVEINESNWQQLAVLSFLSGYPEHEAKNCIRTWLKIGGIEKKDFEPYYQVFPEWMPDWIGEVYGEEEDG